MFRGDEAQISAMRRWLAGLLPECPARDDVITVAVEFATNAIKHTASGRDGCFAAEIAWHHTVVRIVIADQGAPSGPRLVDDPLAEHGRGLQVVHALSARTGVAGDPRSRLMWAEVPWTGGAPGGTREPAGFLDESEAAIRDGHDLLARRHTGVLAWFGRATLQWWAMAGHPGNRRLVAADSPDELAWLLDTLQVPDQPRRAMPAPAGPAYA